MRRHGRSVRPCGTTGSGEALPDASLALLIGRYAHRYYLDAGARTVTETVRSFRDYLPDQLPLPHPSWRSRIWIGRNPWFERDVLPELRQSVARLLR
jgi:uracil-DNA glycosylase